MPGARGAAGGPGGVRHGALRDRGTLRRRHRRNEPTAVAASLLPAHLLCVVSVCKLPAHGAVVASKGEEEDRRQGGLMSPLINVWIAVTHNEKKNNFLNHFKATSEDGVVKHIINSVNVQ